MLCRDQGEIESQREKKQKERKKRENIKATPVLRGRCVKEGDWERGRCVREWERRVTRAHRSSGQCQGGSHWSDSDQPLQEQTGPSLHPSLHHTSTLSSQRRETERGKEGGGGRGDTVSGCALPCATKFVFWGGFLQKK